MNTPKRAIFIDIDGCLFSDSGNVCEKYYQSLSRISELIRVANVGRFPSMHLCSGRDRNSVELAANLLGIVNTWMVIEGGAAIFNPTTREIKWNPAVTAKTRKLFNWIGRKKIPRVLKKFKGLQVYPGYLVCHSLERLASMSLEIDAIYKDVRKTLARLIGKKLVRVNSYFNRAVNIVPAGVSKGSAVKFLAELEHIDLSYSLAIGDSEQDFSVFRRVGLVGCPANAAEECKKRVRERKGRIPLTNYAEAVKDIIETYFPEENY